MLMLLGQFDQATNYRSKRTFSSGFRKSSAGLYSLRADLAALHALPKDDLYGRWKVMSDLATKCHLYIEGKRAKGSNVPRQNTPRSRFWNTS